MLLTVFSGRAIRGPIVASTVRVISSDSKRVVRWVLSSTSRSLARSANRPIRPGAAYSANRVEVPEPQQPAPLAGRAHLEHGAVLEAEQLDGAAGQAQPARRERQARRGPGEELVAELPAELADVQRDGRLGDEELGRGSLDRPEPDDGRERSQLGRGHRALLMGRGPLPSAWPPTPGTE